MDSREKMVSLIREKYGLSSPKVLSAMLLVPREEFVSEEEKERAYDDAALPIGYGQTISQPYTVAFMTNLLDLKGNEKVLEIGTGSGYQASLLSLLAKKVYSIERIKPLALRAKETLKKLGFDNVKVKVGDGEEGWEEYSPFGAIVVTAGLKQIPKALFRQLKDPGVLVAPVGMGADKTMTKYIKKEGKVTKRKYGIFYFVPFV